MMYTHPIAYFITFTTRGSWLHGDDRGSYSPEGTYIEPDPLQYQSDQERRGIGAFILTPEYRQFVDSVIRSFCCKQKSWTVHALSVRSNHIHIALTAHGRSIESVAKALKAITTKQLRESKRISSNYKPWTEHASTRYVFTHENLRNVVRYINHQDNR